MNLTFSDPHGGRRQGLHVRLTPEVVRQIEAMLNEVGEYGEVRLIVQRGELRYVNAVQSHKVVGPHEED